MIGIIYAGDYGSRLFPLTLDQPRDKSMEKGIEERCYNINAVPKPLAPVTNSPIITSALYWMSLLGVDKVVVTVGYLKNCFKKSPLVFGGLEIILDGTGGSSTEVIHRITSHYTPNDNLVFMNADIVSNGEETYGTKL